MCQFAKNIDNHYHKRYNVEMQMLALCRNKGETYYNKNDNECQYRFKT